MPQVFIDCISFEHSLCTKFHGILIGSKLNFPSHFRKLCNKVSREIGVCIKLVITLPVHNLRDQFVTLFYQIVMYSNKIGGHSPSAQSKRLKIKFNKSVKLIGNVRDLTVNYQILLPFLMLEHAIFSLLLERSNTFDKLWTFLGSFRLSRSRTLPKFQ